MQHEIFLNKSDVINWIQNSEIHHHAEFGGKTIRFVDLFSGCGGLSCGIHFAAKQGGMNAICAFAIDSKLAPIEVYKDNIPYEDEAVINANILDVMDIKSRGGFTDKELALKKQVGKVDVLVAGPPCQGHSNLNNSTRRNDPRNGLYLSCIRAVELFEPHLIIIENVPTVIHSTEGVVQTTEQKFKDSGYYVNELTVNFLDLGIPQSRKRHVLIASKNEGFCKSLATLNNRRQTPTLREFISNMDLDEELMFKAGKLSLENTQRVDFLFDNELYDLPNEHRPPCHRDKQHSYNSSYGRLNYDKPAQTLTSGYGSMGQGRYIHPEKRRTINSREASRIQGFPDCFSFSKVSKLTELRQMIANAVPPQLSYVILKHYINSVMKYQVAGEERG